MTAETSSAAERKSPKRVAILAGAREVFAEVGYERACVDVIAARAGVSKATVYSHFGDKSALFLATFADETDDMRSRFVKCISAAPSGDIAADLQKMGESWMALTLSPAVVSLYRHTSTECARFPEMGRTLYDRGAGVVYPAVASRLQHWEAKGELTLEDAHVAAVHLGGLLQGDLYFRAQIGILPTPSTDLVRENVTRGVRVFLRAYAPAGR